jgi:hypothetical protein
VLDRPSDAMDQSQVTFVVSGNEGTDPPGETREVLQSLDCSYQILQLLQAHKFRVKTYNFDDKNLKFRSSKLPLRNHKQS